MILSDISNSIPLGSTVVDQWEVMTTWSNGNIVDKENYNQIGWSYREHVRRTVWLIARKGKHMKAAPFTVEHYLMDHLYKDRKMDTLEEILRHVKKQPLQDDNNTNAETNHNRHENAVPDIGTAKWLNKIDLNVKNWLETNNNNTVELLKKESQWAQSNALECRHQQGAKRGLIRNIFIYNIFC